MSNTSSKTFTGYHMTAILFGFFGIVIAVNIYMARVAIGSFGGTVVDNSYVASQKYNEWLAEANKEAKLGWAVKASRDTGNRLVINVTGIEDFGDEVSIRAKATHPLGRAPERSIGFQRHANGKFLSATALPSGRWSLHIEVTRGADRLRSIAEIR